MGRNSFAYLFRGISGLLKLKRPLTPPTALSETGTLDFFRDLAELNTTRQCRRFALLARFKSER